MSDVEADAAIRLTHCPQCGYELRGLPRAGKCPECAAAYDESMFSIEGRQRIDRFMLGCAGTLFVIGLLGLILATPAAVVIYGAIGLVVLLVAVPHLPQMIRPNPKLLIFTNEGVAAQHASGDLQIVPWSEFRHVRLRRRRTGFDNPARGGQWLLSLYREPNPVLFNRERRPGRFFWTVRDVHWQFNANEEQARAIADAVRRRFEQGWGVSPADLKAADSPQSAEDAARLARFRPRQCVHCGYDLRGSPDAKRCSECGAQAAGVLVVFPERREVWRRYAFILPATTAYLFCAFTCVNQNWLIVFGFGAILLFGAMSIVRVRPKFGVPRDGTALMLDYDGVSVMLTARPQLIEWIGVKSVTVAPLRTLDENTPMDGNEQWRLNFNVSPSRLEGMWPRTTFTATPAEAKALQREATRRLRRARMPGYASHDTQRSDDTIEQPP